jgi:plastocyanin
MKVRILLAVCFLPLLVVSLQAQTQQPVFPVIGSFAPPGLVLKSAAGDFDGDGVSDFVYTDATTTGSSQTPHVVVLLNRGADTPPVVVTSATLPCAVTALQTADMNKDGKLDVVLSCSAGYVVVLLGNGDGSFQAPVYYSATTVNGILQLQPPVDLNGDGYPDIVGTIGLTQGDAVAIWLNKGSSSPGVLSNQQNYPYPNNAAGPIAGIGDFNGDGKQDVAILTSTTTASAAIFFGNGDGTLQTGQVQSQTCSTGSLAALPVAGDFNNDGISDLAVECSANANGVTSMSLQTWLGSSGGQLTAGPTTSFPVLQPGNLISIGKNGDNNLDLALQDSGLSILLGDGKGGFTSGQTYGISGTLTAEPPDPEGKVNLVLYVSDALFSLNSNGDGTFQAPLSFSPASVTADFNGDGIADVLGMNGSNLIIALGRGDGTFTVTNQQPSVSGTPIAADLDGDGKVDAVIIEQGAGVGHGEVNPHDAQLYFYKGNGDGTVQAAGSPIDIPIFGSLSIVAADFNGDGKVDLLLAYDNLSEQPPTGFGLMLLTGNGDGTFAVPSAPFFEGGSGWTPPPGAPPLAGDLNGDHQPDLIWGSTVFINNGDGTFQRFPLAINGTPHAIADLNGDGKLDLIEGLALQDPVTQSYSYPESVFAGNGDGTFQASPFYSATLPQYAQGIAAVVGDVNNDGNPDVLLEYSTTVATSPITIFFGDGAGNFTQDSNTYYAGFSYSLGSPTALSLVRLNNQAPALGSDKALDLLAFSNLGVTPLLNQNNPAPGPLAPISSHVSIAVSSSSAAVGQQFTFTVSVTGANPTGTVTLTSGSTTLATKTLAGSAATVSVSFTAAGAYPITANYSGDSSNLASAGAPISVTVTPAATTTTLSVSPANPNQGQAITYTATVTGVTPTGTVTFTSGTTTLGKSSVTNGVATLSASFATAGTYSVTASYSGDANNQASTSGVQSITVVAPDYSLTANPTAATIKAGQTATFAISMTSVGGYSGTVKLSCGTLPAEVTCNFSPATLTGSGSVANTTLTVTTTAPVAMLERPGSSSTQLAVWAVILGLCFSPRRALRSRKQLARMIAAILIATGSLIYLTGCSSSSAPTPKDPGTPIGMQSIAVSAADSGSGPSHSLNLQLIVQ